MCKQRLSQYFLKNFIKITFPPFRSLLIWELLIMNFILFLPTFVWTTYSQNCHWNEVIDHGYVTMWSSEFSHIVLHSYHGEKFIGIGQKQYCSGMTLCIHSMDYIGIRQASQMAPMTDHQSKGFGMDVPDSLFHASPPNTYLTF